MMVEQYCQYICGKCKKRYDSAPEAHKCEDNHTNPEDIVVVKVDYDHDYDHITGYPQAITTVLKGNRRAVYVLCMSSMISFQNTLAPAMEAVTNGIALDGMVMSRWMKK